MAIAFGSTFLLTYSLGVICRGSGAGSVGVAISLGSGVEIDIPPAATPAEGDGGETYFWDGDSGGVCFFRMVSFPPGCSLTIS